MGNYEELKAAVASVIKTNGNQEITGQVLQNTLTTLISQVGANATFAGIATPDTAPGTPDQNVFYLATKPSTYVNFNSLIVNPGEIAIFSITGNSWVKTVVGEFADITTQRIIKDVLPGTITPIYPTWIRGEYYNSAGEVATTATWERAVMDITPYLGQNIYLRLANLGASYSGYCAFVNTGTGQKQVFTTAQSTNMLNIVVPAWATELRISNRWAMEPNPLIQISSIPMLAKQSDIDMIVSMMPKDNISDAWITGEYYNQTGGIGVTGTWSRLPEIDISANVGQILYCYGHLEAAGYVVIKNTAGNIINTYQFIGNYQITIPAEAATILICNRTASIPNPYFSFSNSILPIAPLDIIEELQGKVSVIDSILPKAQSFLFIQGSITVVGTENSDATRIRTPDFCQLGSPMLLFSNAGFGYRVFEYDQNYTYLGWTGFEAGGQNTFTKKYANTKYYKFVVLKTNSAAITPAEISDSGFSINGNKPNGYQEVTPLSNVLQLFPGMPSNVVLTWIRGEYYTNTGAVGVTATWERAEPLDVSGYTEHYIVFNGELVAGGYGVYTDENDAVILTFQTTNQRYTSTIPAGAKWLKISNRWATVAKASVFINGAGNIPRLAQLSDIDMIVNMMPKDNISDAWITGEYYNQTGGIGVTGTWSRLPEIDISANVGQILYCYGHLEAAGYVVIKNTAGNIINTYQFIGNYQITIPAEAATILICNRTASIPNPYFSFSNSILPIAPLDIIEELQGKVSVIDSILPKAQSFLFIQGSITVVGTENSDATRIRTPDFCQLGSPMLLFSNAGFGYRVFEYDQNYTYLGWTGFEAGGQNTFTKKYANTKYYKFVVLKTNSAAITPAEISDSGFSINGNKPNGYQEVTPLSNVLQLFPGMPSNVVLTWIRGEYYTNTGAVGVTATWERAEPLDVSGYTEHYIVFNGELVAGGYGVYTDENDAVILTFQTTNQRYTSTIPAGAKWLKISNRWATVAKASVFINGAGNIPRLAQLSDITVPKNNNLVGKKVAFIGDSITAAGGYATTFAALYGCTVVNLGVSSTCIANNTSNNQGANRFVTRATAENLAGVDLIVVFGGTNDFSYDIKPIGDLFVAQDRTATGNIGNKTIVAPADTDAFGGALHDLIKTIQTNAPTIPIVFMTPLRRGRYTASNPTSLENNKNGNFMREFAEAIIEICTFYSIPVLDLNAVSNLDFTNTDIAAKYSSDTLHPNAAGHTLIGNMLFRFVEANLIIL